MKLKNKPLLLKTPYGNVSISRISNGIPEIKANSEPALYFAQGWVQMNDRQLQAYMLKIIFSGKASECLNPDLVSVDEYIRCFPFLSDPKKEISKLKPTAKQNLEAFTAGCNNWFETNKPQWEWKLLGYKPEKWKPEDILVIANAFGFVGLTDMHLNTKKLIVQMIQNGIEDEKIRALFPNIKEDIDRETIEKIYLGPTIVPKNINWYVPSFAASNNWALSPKVSGSTAILANDPHLQIDRLPAIWQEIILDLDGQRFKGFGVPGIPGAIVGRTKNLAWGTTYSFLDMLEYRIEHIKNGKYLRGKEWLPLRKRVEVIKVKNNSDIKKDYWETDHGLVEGYNESDCSDGYYLSLAYSAAKDVGANEIMAIFDLFNAANTKEGIELFKKFESPSFNWVLADNEGNIGYQMSGRAFKRKKNESALIPKKAWDLPPMIYLEADELPTLYNPEEGIIITANEDKSYLTDYMIQSIPMHPYRADRIARLLKDETKTDLKKMKAIQLDLYSIQAESLMNQASKYLTNQKNNIHLKEWNFYYDPDSIGAVYFERYYKKLLELSFCKKQIGEEIFNHIWNESNIFNSIFGFFDSVLLKKECEWFSKEDKEKNIKEALEYSLAFKPIPMKKFRKTKMKHIFFGDVLPSFLGFDHGPVHFPGSRSTINQGQFYRNGGMNTSFCPSFRMVTDMGQSEVYTNLVGGVSDRRFSKLYKSDLKLFMSGKYKKVT